MKYAVLSLQQHSENTAEFGFGDYCENILYIALVVDADTERKAQNAAKKVFPRMRFSGQFGARMLPVNEKFMRLYATPTDARLSPKAQELHNASLQALA